MKIEAFRLWRGIAAPMLRNNIDTDAIIPSREMKRVSKTGLSAGLFAGERYVGGAGRDPNPEFVLNQPEYRDTSVLLAGDNFGCGSSREHAVWALHEFGIRAIIASGFGVIFANNCVRNGLLPVVLGSEQVAQLADWSAADPQNNCLEIDLENQRVCGGELVMPFECDAGARHMLLNGLDAIALTLERREAIDAFAKARREAYPWLYSSL